MKGKNVFFKAGILLLCLSLLPGMSGCGAISGLITTPTPTSTPPPTPTLIPPTPLPVELPPQDIVLERCANARSTPAQPGVTADVPMLMVFTTDYLPAESEEGSCSPSAPCVVPLFRFQPLEVQTLLCIHKTRERTTSYGGDIPGYQVTWDVELVQYSTGAVIEQQIIKGEKPPLVYFYSGDRPKEVYGHGPSMFDIEMWLLDRAGDPLFQKFGMRVFPRSGYGLYAYDFSPDLQFLATASPTFSVEVWRISDGERVHEFAGHQDEITEVAFSPDGTLVASGSVDQTVRLWSMQEGNPVSVFDGLSGRVDNLWFTPDGQYLIAASQKEPGQLWDVYLWQLSTGRLEGKWKKPYIRASSSLSDGIALASLGVTDQNIEILLLPKGETITIPTMIGSGKRIAFSPDGQIIATGSPDGNIELWNVTDRAFLRSLRGYEGEYHSFSFSPDGKLLAAWYETNLWLWRVSDGQRIGKLDHPEAIILMRFSPDGQILATSSRNQDVRLWRIPDFSLIATFTGAGFDMIFSPDGSVLATTFKGENRETSQVILWSVFYNRRLQTIYEPQRGIWQWDGMEFLSDGSALVLLTRNAVWLAPWR